MEKVIVSLTTWHNRIGNIPKVLDSIYAQTMLPDKVVLNLAYGEEIPEEVATYIEKHGIEVYYTEDTKVYKKFVPTLKRYPEACVINIDDDFIYPPEMIQDFMEVHKNYPDHPISGNKYIMYGLICHCGWASLTKYEYYGTYLEDIDSEFIRKCAKSDIAFTYLAAKAGHPYVITKGLYSTNMPSFNEVDPYTPPTDSRIDDAYRYLVEKYGEIDRESLIKSYMHDDYIASIIGRMEKQYFEYSVKYALYSKEQNIRSSHAYRVGNMLLKPLKWLRK